MNRKNELFTEEELKRRPEDSSSKAYKRWYKSTERHKINKKRLNKRPLTEAQTDQVVDRIDFFINRRHRSCVERLEREWERGHERLTEQDVRELLQ